MHYAIKEIPYERQYIEEQDLADYRSTAIETELIHSVAFLLSEGFQLDEIHHIMIEMSKNRSDRSAWNMPLIL